MLGGPANRSPFADWGIRIAGVAAVFIGGVWLFFWLTGWAQQWSAAGRITVKTNMALGQLLGGVALLFLGTGASKGLRRAAGNVLAIMVLLIGSLTLSEHLFGLDLGIDQLLASESPDAVATVSPNRIGPIGSSSLILMGIGLLALSYGRRGVASFLGLAVCAITLVPAVGFLYGIRSLYSVPRLTGIAWPTVVALTSLGLGLVMSHADGGPMSILQRRDAGGKVFRRLLPVVILAPILLGYLQILLESSGTVQSPTNTGLYSIAVILVFAYMLWHVSARVSRESTTADAAHEALRESEERLALAASGTRVGIFDTNLKTNEITATEQTMRLLGMEFPTTTTTTTTTTLSHIYKYCDWAKRVHPEDLPKVEAEMDRCAAEHAPLDAVYRLRDHDSTVRWLAMRGIFQYDDHGSPARFLGILMDITGRKRSEEAVAAAHRRIQSIIDNTPALVYALDLEERFLMANSALAELLNSTPERMIGRKRHEFMPKEDADWHEANDREVFEAGKALEFEEYSQLKGRSITWLTTKFPLKDAQGKIYGVAGISADMSDRKRAEETLKSTVAEKEFLLRELAHRTKNNMQVISGLMNLQAATYTDEKLKSAFGDTQDRIRAMALVHEKLYRSDNFSSLNVKEYIEDLMDNILRAHHDAGRSVRAVTDLDDVSISIDSALPLGLIINELVSNSLKHAFPGRKTGEIFLSFKANGGRAELIYRDDGRGMPKEFDLSRALSLGLRLVHNLAVLQLRGTMEIRHGSGAEFAFAFDGSRLKAGA